MNKLLQIIMVVTIAAASLLMTSTAFAEAGCTIENTGQGSTNECIQKEDFICKVTNDNKIEVYNENDQLVATGDAKVEDNNESASATTGTATNANNVTFNVTIENGACEVAEVTQPPVTPGGGAGAGSGVGAASAPSRVTPAALPVTSGNVLIDGLGAIVGLMGLGAGGFYLVNYAYRRLG